MHENHRDRVKQRFLREGIDGFADHEVLEFLLFFAIPQKDTNPIAHTLLDHFGSLSAVFEADICELTQIPGIGTHAAILLKSVPSLARRYITDGIDESETYDNVTKIGEYFIKKYIGCSIETVYLMLLDNKYHIIDCIKTHEGSVNSAQVSTRKLAETALFKRAPMAVIAHNHPNGNAIPSSDDLYTTQLIHKAFSALGITLVEHILVAGDTYAPLLYSSESVFLANDRIDKKMFYRGLSNQDI